MTAWTGIATAIPCTNGFIAHWNLANTELGIDGPFTVVNGTTVAQLTTLRNTLDTQQMAVEEERNGREGARTTIETHKAALLVRLVQFNGAVRGLAPGSTFEGMLPAAFSQGDAPGKVVRPLNDVLSAWTRFESEGPSSDPLLLAGDYTLEMFTLALAALKVDYEAYEEADRALAVARAERDKTMALIYPILKSYRSLAPARFGADSPIGSTLPRLSPLPGHTPDPVEASGSWNATEEKAVFVWEASTDPAADHYEARGTVGPVYEEEDATALGTFALTDERVLETDFGLDLAGANLSVRIFVITAEGNERGSNTVTVVRPAG